MWQVEGAGGKMGSRGVWSLPGPEDRVPGPREALLNDWNEEPRTFASSGQALRLWRPQLSGSRLTCV